MNIRAFRHSAHHEHVFGRYSDSFKANQRLREFGNTELLHIQWSIEVLSLLEQRTSFLLNTSG